MNTQLAKMLLLLTMTAGFASAATLQVGEDEADQNSLTVTQVTQSENEGNKIRVVEIYSGEKIYNDILKDERWKETLLNFINNPRKVPENPGHWVYGKNWGDDKYVWNDDFIATVDQEKDGNVKFFEATSYFPEEFAKDANCGANKMAYDIWQNMTKLKTLDLDYYAHPDNMGEAYCCLRGVVDGLDGLIGIILNVSEITESQEKLEKYDSLIKGITAEDIATLKAADYYPDLPGSTLREELCKNVDLFGKLTPQKEVCIGM